MIIIMVHFLSQVQYFPINKTQFAVLLVSVYGLFSIGVILSLGHGHLERNITMLFRVY